jgi:hypothetical protein
MMPDAGAIPALDAQDQGLDGPLGARSVAGEVDQGEPRPDRESIEL